MKTAVVTGTSYGLGNEIAKKLVESGYKVYGISRSETKIDSANFCWIEGDLSVTENIEEIASQIKEEKIELLVNNVGTHFEEKVVDFKVESFDKMFGLNFLAPVVVTKALLAKLCGGRVINISSTSDRFAELGSGLYCASKAALGVFFETFAMENPKIKMIHLLPNYVDTPLQRSMEHFDNFDWKQCVAAEKVADLVKDILDEKVEVENNSKIVILNNYSLDADEDPEILYSYNVDTGKVKNIKKAR